MYKILLPLILAVFTFMPAGDARAAAGVGDALPHAISTPDANGQMQDFESLTGEKGLVLVFVRSLDWCPYCRKQVMELNENLLAFTAAGYNVASVSYDAPDTLKAFKDRTGVTITLLSDQNSEIIKAFGILNEDQRPGTRFYGIPHPAIYVIQSDKTIRAVLAENGYKDRPALADVLSALE